MRELATGLLTPLRALAIAAAGALIAYLWFNDDVVLALVIAGAIVVVAWGLEQLGHASLPGYPRTAVPLLECWIIVQAVLAALASATVVIATVAFTMPEGTPAETKETVGALSTALTTFLTASLISWTSDEKDSRLADRIRDTFQAHYGRKEAGRQPGAGVHLFAAESTGERWVYSDEAFGVEGWAADARRKRAAGIAAALKQEKT